MTSQQQITALQQIKSPERVGKNDLINMICIFFFSSGVQNMCYKLMQGYSVTGINLSLAHLHSALRHRYCVTTLQRIQISALGTSFLVRVR